MKQNLSKHVSNTLGILIGGTWGGPRGPGFGLELSFFCSASQFWARIGPCLARQRDSLWSRMLQAWPLWLSFQLKAASKRDRFGSARLLAWSLQLKFQLAEACRRDALALNGVQPVRYGSNFSSRRPSKGMPSALKGSHSPRGLPSQSALHLKVVLSCRVSS